MVPIETPLPMYIRVPITPPCAGSSWMERRWYPGVDALAMLWPAIWIAACEANNAERPISNALW